VHARAGPSGGGVGPGISSGAGVGGFTSRPSHSRGHSYQSISGPGATQISSGARTDAIPIAGRATDDAKERQSSSSTTAQSWSSSFQHVQAPIPSPGSRPHLSSSKTYTEGAVPPAPGTTVNGTASSGTTTKLPPGGAWEMVEPSEATDTPPQGQETGAEVVKADMRDILAGT
jgi:hypothetical protein